MRGFLRRTRVRLALGVAGAFLAVSTLAAVGVWLAFSRIEYRSIDSTLSAQVQTLLATLQDSNGRFSLNSGDPLPGQSAGGIAIGALLVDANGKVLDTSGAAPKQAAGGHAIADALSQHSTVTATVTDTGHAERVVATPVDLGNGSTGVLLVGRAVDELQTTLLELAILLGVSVVVLTAVVALLAYRVAGRAMRPVRSIAATARELSEHDLHRRLELDLPPDELGELAATFNGMLARLESAFAALQQFTADAAHELRAPLTLLRTELEVTLEQPRRGEEYRSSVRVALAEVEALTRIAEQLLTLARADAGALVPALADVDLGDLADETVERWRPLARTRDVRLEAQVIDEGAIRADPQLLRRVLDNLVDNALRYTPANGEVRVAVTRETSGWCVRVSDTGPGVPDESRPSLFERFTRGDGARGRDTGGAGLGLALCRAIVEHHGGSIALEESAAGACFSVRLPAPSGEAVPAVTPSDVRARAVAPSATG